LYQPLALSCGHVVCQSCFFKKGGSNHRIFTEGKGEGKKEGIDKGKEEKDELTCTICSIPIGTTTVRTCRLLNHVLAFPQFQQETEKRKEEVERRDGASLPLDTPSPASIAPSEKSSSSTKSEETAKAMAAAAAAMQGASVGVTGTNEK
jgi:hypothetical protein